MKQIKNGPTTGNFGRIQHFLRIARSARTTWHRAETKAGNSRVVQFCRIARGQRV